jgi:hypothetical protein
MFHVLVSLPGQIFAFRRLAVLAAPAVESAPAINPFSAITAISSFRFVIPGKFTGPF